MTESHAAQPLVCVVGYAALDILKFTAAPQSRAMLRFGGVCSNIARVLGMLGARTIFFTPRYTCELARSFAHELNEHKVNWQHLAAAGPMAIFEAQVGPDGELTSAQFSDWNVAQEMDAAAVQPVRGGCEGASFLVACTDYPVDALEAVWEICRASSGSRFCLISTSSEEVNKIAALAGKIDFLSINIAEMQLISDFPFVNRLAAARYADRFLQQGGASLITLGGDGAILVDTFSEEIWYQAVPRFDVSNSVGAGDVLTACVLSAVSKGANLPTALSAGIRQTLSFLTRPKDQNLLPFANVLHPWRGAMPPIVKLQG